MTSSNRSRRGAARVSAVWVISAAVLFLVAVAFGFIAHGDLALERERADQAVADRAEAVDQTGVQAELKQNITRAVGFYDRESADPTTDVDALKVAFEDFKSNFKDLGAADPDIQSVLPKVVSSYNQLNQRIADLEAQVQTLEGQLSSARSATSQVQSDKDSVIADLRQQIADTEQNATQRQNDLESQIATLTSEVSDRDQDVRRAESEKQDLVREHGRQIRSLEGRIAELSLATRPTREPFANYPDGKVIETSSALNIGWIDLGANNRLTRGTRFRVEGGASNDRRFKAMAEVVSVDARRAEVQFYDIRDRYDPVVAGDVIINPLFDPSGERNAVLAGRFSGTFNERELTLLLARIGITVQDDVDNTTHFLIVGSDLFADPETNEPLEEPMSPIELPAYREAEALGVQIVPLQDVQQFFRADTSVSG